MAFRLSHIANKGALYESDWLGRKSSGFVHGTPLWSHVSERFRVIFSQQNSSGFSLIIRLLDPENFCVKTVVDHGRYQLVPFHREEGETWQRS